MVNRNRMWVVNDIEFSIQCHSFFFETIFSRNGNSFFHVNGHVAFVDYLARRSHASFRHWLIGGFRVIKLKTYFNSGIIIIFEYNSYPKTAFLGMKLQINETTKPISCWQYNAFKSAFLWYADERKEV